jgi:hypothetical protein
LSVVVDQTRGPSDALLFGTTLAQSLGSVNLPSWKPGTMLTVRLLTQGANGDVVADAVFDPPSGTATIERVGTHFFPTAENRIAVSSAPVRPFARSGPASVPMGVGLELTVLAEDAFGNVNAGSRDTVHLRGTDFTQDITFSNNDNGVHIFSYTYNALAFQPVRITDTTNSSIWGSRIVDVLAQAGGGGGPRVSSARPPAEWTGLLVSSFLVSWEDVDGFPMVAAT